MLYHVAHGDITPKPDILHLAGDKIHFTDGTSEIIDLIVYATGYNVVFPFIDPKFLNWRDGRPRLYQNVFHPEYDNLFVVGMIQPDSGQFGLVDWQARAAAAFLAALRDGSPTVEKFRRRKQADEASEGGIRYQTTAAGTCSRSSTGVIARNWKRWYANCGRDGPREAVTGKPSRLAAARRAARGTPPLCQRPLNGLLRRRGGVEKRNRVAARRDGGQGFP